jgi:hypothetical protein
LAVELFTIHCTTCKARLVVKDESVIGSILSCPKCSSMVQVVPPVGWKRPGSGDSSPGELAAVSAAASQPAAPVSEPPAKKVAAATAAAVPPALPPRPAPPPATAVTPAAPEAASTLFSAVAGWAKRDWPVLSSGLAGGVVLGAAVWLVVAMQSTAPVVVAERAAADASPADAASTEQTSPPAAAAPAAKKSQLADVAVPADEPRDEPQVVAEATVPPEPGNAKSATPAVPKDAQPQAAQVAPNESAEAAAAPEHGRSLKLEPIRSSGPPLELSAAVPSAAVPSAANTTPEELVGADPEAVDDAGQSPESESPGNPAPFSREQIDERLAVSLASVEFAEVPLAQFAAFIADVSGVPVTLDEGALAKAGQGGKTPISVKLSGTTAGEALRAAAKGAGLSIAVQDGRIVVTRGGE